MAEFMQRHKVTAKTHLVLTPTPLLLNSGNLFNRKQRFSFPRDIWLLEGKIWLRLSKTYSSLIFPWSNKEQKPDAGNGMLIVEEKNGTERPKTDFLHEHHEIAYVISLNSSFLDHGPSSISSQLPVSASSFSLQSTFHLSLEWLIFLKCKSDHNPTS